MMENEQKSRGKQEERMMESEQRKRGKQEERMMENEQKSRGKQEKQTMESEQRKQGVRMYQIQMYQVNHQALVRVLETLCRTENMAVRHAGSAREVLQRLADEASAPDLLLCMISFQKEDLSKNLRLISEIRASSRIPLIVASREDQEENRILALNAGADDFVSATANPLEILARIKSHLRRRFSGGTQWKRQRMVYQVEGLELDDAHRKVFVDQREICLTPKEYQILRLLIIGRGQVFTVNQIYESVWKEKPIGAENTIAVHIRHIRKKIENDSAKPKYLKAVWGLGYKVG